MYNCTHLRGNPKALSTFKFQLARGILHFTTHITFCCILVHQLSLYIYCKNVIYPPYNARHQVFVTTQSPQDLASDKPSSARPPSATRSDHPQSHNIIDAMPD